MPWHDVPWARAPVDICLRIPVLLFLDSLQRGFFHSAMFPHSHFALLSFASLAHFLFSFACWTLAVVIFTLHTHSLLAVYRAVFSPLLILLSAWLSHHDPDGDLSLVLLQLLLALVFMLLKAPPPSDAPLLVRLCSSDVLIIVCFLHQTLLTHSGLLLYALLLANELRLLTTMHRAITQHLVLAFITTQRLVTLNGSFAFLKAHWTRLRVTHVHSAFWVLRVTFVLFVQLSQFPWQESMKQVLNSSCETVVMLFGMACIISHITHLLHRAIAAFLCLEADTEAGSMGATSGVLFFILALQTGLLGMAPEQKLSRLYRNCCLLLTAVLHFTHGLVHPPLMSLSASHSTSMHRHTRALLVALLLLVIPSVWLRWLWAQHSLSTWLLAMTAFSVEIIIKTLVSLLIYGLFMLDAYLSSFWESLDDYVYCIQAAGSSFEFVCGIFLFCNGAWIVVFESGGVIRALMMAIHAYFNIFMQAKKGWRTFVLRRTAVRKISLLAQATAEQLQEHDDVCAICFQELTSARVTTCRHLFHGVCLRKWLYVRDECPLCHQAIFTPQ